MPLSGPRRNPSNWKVDFINEKLFKITSEDYFSFLVFLISFWSQIHNCIYVWGNLKEDLQIRLLFFETN